MRIPIIDFRSHRRRLLDEALTEHEEVFGGTVLDVGGGHERGDFSRPTDAEWIVIDVIRSHLPTVIADGSQIPIKDDSVDVVKCTEVLEHVRRPEEAIDEIRRVLRPGGTLVLSMPFNYGIHGDPNDFQRFTESKHEELLSTAFDIRHLKSQGAFFTVIAYMFQRAIVNAKTPLKRLAYPLLPIIDAIAGLDRLSIVRRSDYYQSFTTGYFVVARKQDDPAQAGPVGNSNE